MLAIAVALSACLLGPCARGAQFGASTTTDGRGLAEVGRLPQALAVFRFIENRGQWPADKRFVLRQPASEAVLDDRGWTLRDPRTGACLRFEPTIGEAHAVPARLSFAGVGDDGPCFQYYSADRHVEGARSYARVVGELKGPGIDGMSLVFREGKMGELAYDLHGEAGRDIERLRIRVEGATALRVDAATGELVCEVGRHALRQQRPTTFGRAENGAFVPLVARYVVNDASSYGFELETPFDGPVVVDPGLVWSSYFGGSGRVEGIFDLEVDAEGSTYVCGFTDSVVFPVVAAEQPRFGGGSLDGFVARIAADGKSLLWCSYLGGGGEDSLLRLARAPDGTLWTGGYTTSTTFPTLLPLQTALAGAQDATLAQWSDQGKLRFSTYWGGAGSEVTRGIAFDAAGRVHFAGITSSSDFPTTQAAYQQGLSGAWDAFAVAFDGSTRTLVYATCVGGLNTEDLWGFDVLPSGEAVLAMTTQSPFLPVSTGALGLRYVGGAADGYVFQLDRVGAKRLASTYLGGDGDDRLSALHVLPDDSIAVCAWSDSTNLPTRDALQSSPRGNYDGYVAHLSADLTSLRWGSYLGGKANDFLWDLDVDAAGMWTVAGLSYSSDFPVTLGSYKTTLGRNGSTGGDAVVARLAPWLRPPARELVYASYVGGSDFDYAYTLDVRDQEATLAGETASFNYETTNGAFQVVHGGNTGEAMVTRLDLLPASCTRYGRSSPCRDELPFEPSEDARRGATSFAMISGGLPPLLAGILSLCGPAQTGGPHLGAVAYLDPALPILTFPLASDALGNVELRLPLPMQPLRFALQAYFLRVSNCVQLGPLVSSPAIEIDVR